VRLRAARARGLPSCAAGALRCGRVPRRRVEDLLTLLFERLLEREARREAAEVEEQLRTLDDFARHEVAALQTRCGRRGAPAGSREERDALFIAATADARAADRSGRFYHGEMVIEPFDKARLDEVVRLSLARGSPCSHRCARRCCPPSFARSFATIGARLSSRGPVCMDPEVSVWVAVEQSRIAGFAALKLHPADQMGEVYMIAVDPDFQRRGIAARLTAHSVAWFRNAGMSIAMVETGGDPGHAPARRTYEASGFQLLPVARYFKGL
jgi:GNAT superfamily N-acetyltransferase